MKNMLTQNIVEDFANITSEEVVANLINRGNRLIDNTMSELMVRFPSLTNYKVILINEFATRSASSKSSFDLLLVIKSAEVEANTLQTNNNKFKTFIKEFFSNFKFKKKRKKKANSEQNLNKIAIQRYDFQEMKKSLFYMLARFADKSTIVYDHQLYIKIKDVNNLDIPINIYPVLEISPNHYATYDKHNKQFKFDFGDRYSNIITFTKNSNGKSLQLLKIINCAYNHIYNSTINQIYAESLIYNYPIDLLNSSSIYESFVLFVNYIDNFDQNKIISITGNKKLFNDELNSINILKHFDFIKKLKQLI